MLRFLVYVLFQLLVIFLTWEGVSIGIYLVNRASDVAVIVGIVLAALSILLGASASVEIFNLWRKRA